MMKIEIVPVVETEIISTLPDESIQSTYDGEKHSTAPSTNIERVFAEFLEMEVGDGAASADTIKSYLSQTKMYFAWCRDNLIPPLEADQDDIKLYRQHLIEHNYAVTTIANKLTIVNSLYKAAVNRGLIWVFLPNPSIRGNKDFLTELPRRQRAATR